MISKQKIYSCKICGAQYPKWLGQCTKCESWNSIEEDIIKKSPKNDLIQSKSEVKKIITSNIEKNQGFLLEYFELRCSKTLKICNQGNKQNSSCRAFICVIADGVRLIDNLLIHNEN